jgi:mycothiol synthase
MTTASQTGYTLRTATDADVAGCAALINAFDAVEFSDSSPTTADDIRADWEDLDPAQDTWVAIAPDGTLCGYMRLADDGGGFWEADGYVHPHHWGCGIGTSLVLASEARAREIALAQPDAPRVTIINHVVAQSGPACDMLGGQGYQLARVFWRMRIDMVAAPAAPVWPAGITVRSCADDADIHQAYDVAEAAFADHWGHLPISFEEWLHAHIRETHDLALWFLAFAGDELAGVALCRPTPDGRGWVRTLAVAREWRGRGLGSALLRHAFGAFWQRGITSVGLGVDSASLTGAQRLYEHAGMRVVGSIARFEKDIRPPNDLGGFQPYL